MMLAEELLREALRGAARQRAAQLPHPARHHHRRGHAGRRRLRDLRARTASSRRRSSSSSPDVYVVTKFGIIRSREEFLDALKRRDIDWNDYQAAARSLRKAEAVAAEAVDAARR